MIPPPFIILLKVLISWFVLANTTEFWKGAVCHCFLGLCPCAAVGAAVGCCPGPGPSGTKHTESLAAPERVWGSLCSVSGLVCCQPPSGHVIPVFQHICNFSYQAALLSSLLIPPTFWVVFLACGWQRKGRYVGCLSGTWLGWVWSRCSQKYRSGICWKDKAVKRGEIIMINGRRMCQWDQTSVSLKFAVFSLYSCFSISLLSTRENVSYWFMLKLTCRKGQWRGMGNKDVFSSKENSIFTLFLPLFVSCSMSWSGEESHTGLMVAKQLLLWPDWEKGRIGMSLVESLPFASFWASF